MNGREEEGVTKYGPALIKEKKQAGNTGRNKENRMWRGQ